MVAQIGNKVALFARWRQYAPPIYYTLGSLHQKDILIGSSAFVGHTWCIKHAHRHTDVRFCSNRPRLCDATPRSLKIAQIRQFGRNQTNRTANKSAHNCNHSENVIIMSD